MHDSYRRRLKDLPLAGQSVVIRLTVRRFLCTVANCPRRTFAEPFTRLTAPYARFTSRLGHVLQRVGLALAGRAGARLAGQLGFPVGRMTLLRKVMALPDPQFTTPRVLGVDDFAIRRGQIYSTVLTCGETHRDKPYLERRFAAGCTSVTRLHRELLAENAPVTYKMVRAYIATLRAIPAQASPPPPTVRQVTGWLTRHPTTLSEEERTALKNVLARCPELDSAAEHVRALGEILTNRLGPTLPAWIDAVDTDRLPGLTNFARHLLRDLNAVTAGLTLHWSSGGTEGAVNRIKKIKRQLYGRAGFELLRKLILQ
ncbi:transposase [Streptomyces sp. NPDC047042]|uniref:transposase n=1 Tax=Streptomyces sp. NPDC047042 TaxID=3154807 RepID=UPI00340F7E4C